MAARHRRIATAVATALIVVPAGVGLVGCDAVSKAMDCVQTADVIADSVTDLQQAAENAADNPAEADRALDDIGKNLDKIGEKTDDTDVDKAVDDLDKAVDNVREAIENGDSTPDVSPVTDAAGELTKVCTP
ncbi:hypothetical protein DCW30_06465 [Streptomyces alfalfae]|uniref:Secreted protein n=2 Tax=Streptomyces alfalfae TaxID=1642299 RepID=A0A1P8TKI1_9ACTN|nr:MULTISPECIES: hypothetical protein [Streptomyces]AYA18468.1 hypothetical protein D3X13_21520 [Streptomyces fradiae]APY88085.1 hypothetical protein A7J05_22410 [Streptomyces alfalfae]KUL54036.1 hypothetical protein ADL30_18015 [Streptomyces sp. NRRL S-1521]QQC89503.1 hypothetical protein I8755_14565 [Streptomyces alfalfae]QUI31943.1 hypothetical protein H9W91_14545 [Streptomyces alfalfae]